MRRLKILLWSVAHALGVAATLSSAWIASAESPVFPSVNEAEYTYGPGQPLYAGMVPDKTTYTIGTSSCGTVSCHGGPKSENHDVQTFSYTIWMNDDPHSKAYEVLHLPRSRTMARQLGLGEAHRAQQCLACHSMQDQSRAPLPAEVLADGVGCASCHGDSANWQQMHTQPEWKQLSKVQRESLGYRDLSGTVARVRNCLACHVGDASHEVNHDLIAAGHPRLTFEFSAYQRIWPRHWSPHNTLESQKDFAERSWAVGQAETLRAVADLLETRAQRASDDIEHRALGIPQQWPEFSEFDCYSCHKALGSESYQASRDEAVQSRRFGQPQWQPWYVSASQLLSVQFDSNSPINRRLDVRKSVIDIRSLLDTEWSSSDQKRLQGIIFEARGVSRAARLAADEFSQQPHIILNRSNQPMSELVVENPQAWQTWDSAVQMYLALEASKRAGPAMLGAWRSDIQTEEGMDLGQSLDAMRASLRFPLNMDSPQTFQPTRFHQERSEVP